MKRQLLTFLFCACLLQMFAQKSNGQKGHNSFIPVDSAKFRINFTPFAFGLCFGPHKLKSELAEQSEFILANTHNSGTTFSFDLQLILKDKIGLAGGIEYYHRTVDKKNIREHFPSISGYTVSINEDDNDGYSPFDSQYDLRLYKVGLAGFIPHNKTAFIPEFEFLGNIESWYPSLEINLTDQLGANNLTREYKYEQSNTYGFKAGCEFRKYLKMREQGKHGRITLEVKVELTYLKLSGFGYYIDKDASGVENKSSAKKFSQDFYSVNFGVEVGGDFHW